LITYIKSYNNKKTTSPAPTAMPALKGDPWIFQAKKKTIQPPAQSLGVKHKNYNGGSWKIMKN
jgi:hypothetical protein